MILDYLMGQTIPDGYYWLDEYGNWGYEGIPIIQGNIFAGLESYGGTSSRDIYSGDASLIHGDDGCVYFSSDAGSISSCN